MKALALYFCLLLPFFSIGQSKSSGTIVIPKLVIDPKKSYYLEQGDSTVSVIIDTLIMHDKAKLNFLKKKKVTLKVGYAVIGKNCVFSGNDNKNNGTDLDLTMNFSQLGSLYVDISGQDMKTGNRNFANGNGGSFSLAYFSSGKKPQVIDPKQPFYMGINNKGGGYTVNPQTDISIIVDQIRNGSRSRPLGNLPNGQVYSGAVGKDGTVTLRAITSLN